MNPCCEKPSNKSGKMASSDNEEYELARDEIDEEEDFVLDLIKSYDVENAKDRGYRLLQEATKQRHKAAIRLLIEKGASVNSDRYFASYTPLHWAVRSGDSEIVELLLDKGAKMSDETWEGLSPFYLAVSGGEEVTHLYLSDRDAREGDSDSPSQDSADLTGIVTLLLSRGSDINQKCWEGQTPLHVACNSRSPLRDRTIEILLEQGAMVNCSDNFGNTPLHVVAVSDIPDPRALIALLLRYGADINAKTGTEETPLHAACRSRSADGAKVVELLIKAGANVNAKSLRGYTPLHMSLSRYQVEISLVLLNNGADLHAPNNDNATPLHYIVRNNNKPILRHIAKHNIADISHSLKVLSSRGYAYFTTCRQQIDLMKSTVIDSSTVTFYDVLVAPDHKLASLASNPAITEAIVSAKDQFPEFFVELHDRWSIGQRRCEALERLKFLEVVAEEVELTYDALLRVAYYLSNDDLDNLIAVFQK